MLLRLLTAAVLIPIVLALVWWGPAWALAIAAAGVAILALIEFFALGERVGLRAFRAWTILCAAGIFYAQYSVGLVETRSVTGSISIVRHLQAGTVPVEIVLLIFVLGATGIGLATRRALQDVPLSQLIWAIILTKDNLWEFILDEACPDRPLEIFGQQELLRLLDQFFDRAIHAAAVGYERAADARGRTESKARKAS